MAEARHVDQKFAEWAHSVITRLKGQDDKKLRTTIRTLPSHIQSSGLAQALLFVYTKQVKEVAEEMVKVLGLHSGGNAVEGVKKLVEGGAADYRRMTRRALLAAQWLKRFGEAMLSKDSSTKEGGQKS